MYVVVQGKVCAWNGFFATGGARFESAEDMKDQDGHPLPAAVVERFVRSGCMIDLSAKAVAAATPTAEPPPEGLAWVRLGTPPAEVSS